MDWVLIMAGGSGERFWPKSRTKTPKQLLPITSQNTMIQLTVKRLEGLVEPENILILTNKLQKEQMLNQLPQIATENIIAEPIGRDTAACIGLASALINKTDSDASMIVLPADHVIHNHNKFKSDLQKCLNFVKKENCLMTIGIKPDNAATGYGYLEISNNDENEIRKVNKFVEKPDKNKATKYLQAGNYYWNSGMFVWKVSTILKELKEQMPQLHEGLTKIVQDSEKTSLENSLEKHFANLEKKSIDYGVMENAENVYFLKASFDWDDVGSWSSIEKHFQSDADGNVCIGNVKLINCKNMLVYNLSSQTNLLATAIDLDNQIIVQTDDAVLSCKKESSQQVKKIVDIIKQEKLNHFL